MVPTHTLDRLSLIFGEIKLGDCLVRMIYFDVKFVITPNEYEFDKINFSDALILQRSIEKWSRRFILHKSSILNIIILH